MEGFKGKVWVFGNDINTDEIIPARYLNTTDPEELAKYCMEDARPGFGKIVRKGDIIVAGKNFGCGSSREHAPIAIKGAGVACVIAKSFARIFYRNAFNIGLPIFEVAEVEQIKEGDILEIDPKTGMVKDLTNGKKFKVDPIPEFMLELIRSGGLMEYAKKLLEERSQI